MSDLSDIKKTREHWYTAYFKGDTDVLEKIEASDFYVTSPKGKEDRGTRYDTIKQAIENGKWFKTSITLEEDALEYLLNDRKAMVLGHGRTLENGAPLLEMQFEEKWVKSKTGWQVQALHLNKVN
jgi:hypothetical protein